MTFGAGFEVEHLVEFLQRSNLLNSGYNTCPVGTSFGRLIPERQEVDLNIDRLVESDYPDG